MPEAVEGFIAINAAPFLEAAEPLAMAMGISILNTFQLWEYSSVYRQALNVINKVQVFHDEVMKGDKSLFTCLDALVRAIFINV